MTTDDSYLSMGMSTNICQCQCQFKNVNVNVHVHVAIHTNEWQAQQLQRQKVALDRNHPGQLVRVPQKRELEERIVAMRSELSYVDP